MLGNDVIDLADPETRSRHPGFDARVFSPLERDAIGTAGEPHVVRQMLWAAKESAYKAARRSDPATPFSPIRFEVALDARGLGRVTHAQDRFRVRVERRGDCLHAVACREGDPSVCRHGVVEVGSDDPSARVRALALSSLSRALGVASSDLRIEKRGRIPELHLRGARLRAPLTLSHHGRYAAYAALP